MTSTQATRRLIADGCRVLANEGLVFGTLGHISARHGAGMLLRARGPGNLGLQFSRAEEVVPATLTGDRLEESPYRLPVEHPLHGETLRLRPDVNVVVHAHPPAVVACTIAGLPLLPIVGAFDIPAARMAHDGIPTYRRSVLVRTPTIAQQILEAMQDRPVCLLAGHGLIAVGDSVPQAVARAIAVNNLAKLTLQIATTGAPLVPIAEEDYQQLPDLGGGLNDDTVWRHLVARLPTGEVQQ
jgi:3,4-dihydroxyphthalate decarboxylase